MSRPCAGFFRRLACNASEDVEREYRESVHEGCSSVGGICVDVDDRAR